MLVDIGGSYRDLAETKDYISVMQEKISYEFAREIEERLDWVQRREDVYVKELNKDSTYIEMENEDLRICIDDINEILQNYIVPIEKGSRINRDKTIKMINMLIKKCQEALE